MRTHFLIAFVILSCSVRTQIDAESYAPGRLFDGVVAAMQRSYYDKTFRQTEWPALAATYRAAAQQAETLDEERVVVDALLHHVPATHLALLSKATHTHLLAELSKRDAPTLGLEVEQHAGQFFVAMVLEGGPAAVAGVRRGDRVLAIDGRAPGVSDRLDRSSDDAYLPDPPRHQLLTEDGARVRLRLQRKPDAAQEDIEVVSATYSAWRAAKASARVFEHEGQRVGYVHYWYIHIGGVHAHFKKLLAESFADCTAVVLDLRGRGGDGAATASLVAAVRTAGKPVVALIDRNTRSAKEVIAYRLRQDEVATLVGEHTARAVIPATFRPIGEHDVLMFPTFTLGEFTKEIELIGVAPHVTQSDTLRYAAGDDAILQAGLREAARQAASAR